MTLFSTMRANAAATHAAYHLVAATDVRLIEATGHYEVVGTCGHRLTVVTPGRDVESWAERIAAGKRHRRRCIYCPKGEQ